MKYWGMALLFISAVACARSDEAPNPSNVDLKNVADQTAASAEVTPIKGTNKGNKGDGGN